MLFFKLLTQSMRAQLEYPANVVMQSLGHVLLTLAEFVALWALFQTFGNLRGWTLAEVAIFYGLVNTAIALADSFSKGFDRFGEVLKSGEFDRLLLRPLSPVFQLLTREVTLRRLGRVLQALVVLGWGLRAIERELTWLELGLVLLSMLSGALVFLGLWIYQAAITFFTIDSLEAMNILTYGGAELGQHPLPIFPRFMRRLFTGVVPVALVVYYPGLIVIGRADPLGAPAWIGYAAPLAGPVFLAGSLLAFTLATRHYTSTGS